MGCCCPKSRIKTERLESLCEKILRKHYIIDESDEIYYEPYNANDSMLSHGSSRLQSQSYDLYDSYFL